MTEKQLEFRLERITERTGVPLVVEYLGRKPMIYAVVQGGGMQQLSPRLGMGEMREWLYAMEKGVELAMAGGKAA